LRPAEIKPNEPDLGNASAREPAMTRLRPLSILLCLSILLPLPTLAETRLPVLVPVTGFLALEGTSQRNGALLALKHANAEIKPDVIDTGATPEGAVTAFERAMSGSRPPAVIAPILGTQMLALLPLAEREKVSLVTISGTAKITELESKWIFRFFPGDEVVKLAQARYTVEKLGKRKPALLYQTTAYGQSGRQHLADQFARLGAPLVYEEGLAPTVKDVLPALIKAQAAGADVLILHLHAPSTALAISQARAQGVMLPIVAGSAMHQPATAELLSPRDLAGVCAETAASPISGGNPEMAKFTQDYRKEFGGEPDAFAAAQYDGTMMLMAGMRAGAKDAAQLRDYLASTPHQGLAMRYRSDGKGNMAHDAIIVCFDGKSRVPAIVERYAGTQ
jgi:branched-chain amino acid transport system substrate-binding protein